MALLGHRLPITSIPKQLTIATVRNLVIDYRGDGRSQFPLAAIITLAKRMRAKEPLSGRPPLARIATLVRGATLLIVLSSPLRQVFGTPTRSIAYQHAAARMETRPRRRSAHQRQGPHAAGLRCAIGVVQENRSMAGIRTQSATNSGAIMTPARHGAGARNSNPTTAGGPSPAAARTFEPRTAGAWRSAHP